MGANGWAPRTAEEFFTDLGRDMRIQGRRPQRQSYFEDDTAVDASQAPELSPLDEFVEGRDDEFPPPTPEFGDSPPDIVETSDFEDIIEEEAPLEESASSAVGMVRAYSDSTVLGSGVAYVDGWTFGQPTGTPIPGVAPAMVVAGDNFIPAASGVYSVRVYYAMTFSGSPSAITVIANGGGTSALGDTTINSFDIEPHASVEEYRALGAFFLYGAGLDPAMPTVGTLGFSCQWSGAVTLSALTVQLDILRIA